MVEGPWGVSLSVVIPMFDEEAALPLLFPRLRPVLDALDCSYEVVCVDDGSRDRTPYLVTAARAQWPELRLVQLVRNAGHQAALTAGYSRARGEYVVTIDADLQDPPEVIAQMLSLARQDHLDVVYGVRSERSSDTWFKRVSAGAYYDLMRRVVGNHVPRDAGDFRLISRRVVGALESIPEQGRVYRLVIPSFGFRSGEAVYAREARSAGETKYPLHKMVGLMFDSVAAFSAAPLRIATGAGLLGGLAGLLALLYSVQGFLTGQSVPGWASILATVGFFGGAQLICIGLLGEYVSKIFVAVQHRPSYLVAFDSDEAPFPSSQPDDRVHETQAT